MADQPETPDASHLIPQAVAELTGPRQTIYAKYRRYFDGKHNLAFATQRFQTAFGSTFREFADNMCPAIINAMVDRLEVTGFEDETSTGGGLGNDAWDLWRLNRMDQGAQDVHTEALTMGDAYVIVWPNEEDPEMPEIVPQDAEEMTVRYSTRRPGHIEWAAKHWKTDDGRMRLNIYLSDRIEKWITKAQKPQVLPSRISGWTRYTEFDEDWPTENPWDIVPVFHFGALAGRGKFGRSILKDIVCPQDALNKAAMDMLIGEEYVGLPQRWGLGLEVELDEETGKPKVPCPIGPEHFMAVTAGPGEAELGQFPQGDLSGLIAIQEMWRKQICRITGVPVHYLMLHMGEWPTGEALKTAEAPFASKVERLQAAFGNVWEDVMALALRMANEKAKKVRLSCLWRSAEAKSDRTEAETAVLEGQAGVGHKQIMRRRFGFTDRQIEEMQAEGDGMAETMLNKFEKGQTGE